MGNREGRVDGNASGGRGRVGVAFLFETSTWLCLLRRALQWEAPSPAHLRRKALEEERQAVLNSKHNHPNKNPGVPRSDFTLSLPGYSTVSCP